jgi:molecular chaperone DnaK (HSP70)
MTKLLINYQKACIYKIVCKDVNITERYVGSTTNLIQRRSEHKKGYNAKTITSNSNMCVYQFIRENGGFQNWDVVMLEQLIDCNDKETLHKRERYYIESLKAELNKVIPTRTQKEYYDDNKQDILEKHKIHYENNRERLKEQRIELYQDNREKVKEQVRHYYQNNSKKIAEYKRAYRERTKKIKAPLL